MNMKTNNFEKEIPSGYRQIFYLNAKSVKVGLIMNLIALVILALVMVVAYIPFKGTSIFSLLSIRSDVYLITMLVYFASLLGYVVLHELVHGVAYWALTRERLTFGVSWSCAFCGVPHIYVKRRVALIASAAPLVVFTLLFLPLLYLLYSVDPLFYLLGATVFGLHLGGCCGDMYIILLLLLRYRDPETLIRDTGPEQTIYVRQNGD